MTTKNFGGYRIGVNIPARAPTHQAVNLAINWGAPNVEIVRVAYDIGKPALDVLQDLAKATGIEYTWHLPPIEQVGCPAYPDKRLQDLWLDNMKRTLESAAKVNAKVMTFHPVHVGGAEPEDAIYVWDERDRQLKVARLPRLPDGSLMPKEQFIKELNEIHRKNLERDIENIKSMKEFYSAGEEMFQKVATSPTPDNIELFVKKVPEIFRYTGMAPIHLEPQFQVIAKKVLETGQPLTESEKRYIASKAEQLRRQFELSRASAEYNIKTTEYFLKSKKPLLK